MRKAVYIPFIVLLLLGCVGTKKNIQKQTRIILSEPFFDNHFTGLLVMDADNRDTIYKENHTKYFTPASNAKIFTLYTSLKLLPDSIPAFKYIEQNDTLFIEGTGDPTFLHSYFDSKNTLDFIRRFEHIALYLNNWKDNKYGPGWSWGDYSYYYQPERSAFPMYGNVATIYRQDSLKVVPKFFNKNVIEIDFQKYREQNKNIFYFDSKRTDTLEIPFVTDTTLTKTLLGNVLDKNVSIIENMPEKEKIVFYNIPKDTVLRRMMQESDNFLAEQLLILASSTLSDTLNISKTQKYMLENHLSDLEQVPRWVDGSGLSRYNLFSPLSMVQMLDKMYHEFPKETLFDVFAVGGVSGTLEDWYPGTPPYIYAKTGTLSNNHCLSGYLITKSGKTLIFSFMSNHYRATSTDLKNRMQQILEYLRDNY